MSTAGMTQYEALQKCLITPETEVPQHRFLLSWQERPCFPRGELVAVTGKAKSGKTYFTSILMALSARPSMFGISRMEESPYRTLWIDTEQSADSTKEILCERIGQMAKDSISSGIFDLLDVYNLRAVNWQDRLQMVEQAILLNHPDLVIFDGIRDVVSDINDGVMAQNVLDRLLSLASYAQCCIVCVLHQNKSIEDKTLRGALGTELQNKSFETYEVSKDKETHVFSVQQTATRKYDITAKLQFSVSSTGLPQLCYTPDSSDNYLLPNGNIDVERIFPEILSSGCKLRSYELKGRILEITGLSVEKSHRAIAAIAEAQRKGIILRDMVSDQEVYYHLPTQPAGFQPV